MALTISNIVVTPPTSVGGTGSLLFDSSGVSGSTTLTVRVITPANPAGTVVYTTYNIGTPATSGVPDLLPGDYHLYLEYGTGTEYQYTAATVTIPAFVPPPVSGCTDAYAANYDPAANVSADTCTYEVLWRSAWREVAVAVAAIVGQTDAYLEADLRIGFRPGHTLATTRPLSDPLRVRATVGPSGFAVFRLGPYLRPQLGAPDGFGGYRLDLNSATAHTDDLYVGYELRRATGEMIEHGYALNSALPEPWLFAEEEAILSPFARIPSWPGFVPVVSVRSSTGAGRYGLVSTVATPTLIPMPCPKNPLAVSWLAPGGGYGFWVFQSRPQLGDEVEDGQSYNEAGTGERRYSERGATRRTITASSGVFKGADLMEGLRTLWRSPQVWYQPDGPNTSWVPVTLEGGSFPAGRIGVHRQEVSITFTEAAPQDAQGQ